MNTHDDFWIQAFLDSLPRCDVCGYALQAGVCPNKRCGQPLKPIKVRRGWRGWVL